MSLDPRIVDLLVEYEEREQAGRPVSAEELCRDCPELLPALLTALKAVAQFPAPSSGNTNVSGAATYTGRDAGTPAPDAAGRHGRFTIVRPHAQGGLGEVLIAHDEELNRDVAFKRMKPQIAAGDDARRRFRLEAEITARLEHPGIVPVYGLVLDERGEPCYAMRFVQGDSFSDAIQHFHRSHKNWHGFAFRHLLQQFISVCQTAAYAHSRGIVHRDIKPANVMFGKYGETLVVDWGLAKPFGRTEVERASGEETLAVPAGGDGSATLMGQTIGTPAYMPPEQAAGRWNIVGPASDIYSLGATLYELLTGRRPAQGNDNFEVLAKVQRGDIPKPRDLEPTLPRALEAICRKAMALKPESRYATAKHLADDVEHWLADEAVSAYAEPALTRLARWARRRPAVVAIFGTGLLTAALALAIGMAIVGRFNRQLGVANRDLHAANIKLDDANNELRDTNAELNDARKTIESRLKQIEKANELLASIFHDLDPRAAEKEGISLQAHLGNRLEEVAAQLEGDALGDPVAVARLQIRLASSLKNLGFYDRCIELMVKALATLKSHLGDDHFETLNGLSILANVYRAAGKLDQALPLAEDSYRLHKQKLGRTHADTANSLQVLGCVYQEKGWKDKALALLIESLDLLKAALGPGHRQTLTAMNNLAYAYLHAGRHPEALMMFEELLKLSTTTLGESHADTLVIASNLASLYHGVGRTNDALALAKHSFEQHRIRLGPDNTYTLGAMNNLAALYQVTGRVADAIPLYEDALKRFTAKLGLEHAGTLMCMANLGSAYCLAGRIPDGLPLLEQSLTLRKKTLGPDHIDTLSGMNELAVAYSAAGRRREGLKLHEETIAKCRAHLPADHPNALTAQHDYAMALQLAGQSQKAIAMFDQAYAKRKVKLGPDHPDTRKSLTGLAAVYTMTEQHDKADPILREIIAAERRKSPLDENSLAVALMFHAKNLATQGKHSETESVLREALAIWERKLPGSWFFHFAQATLGDSLLRQKKYADAEPLLVSGYEGMKKYEAMMPDDGKARISDALKRVVRLYEEWGQPEKAAAWRKKLEAAKPPEGAPTKP